MAEGMTEEALVERIKEEILRQSRADDNAACLSVDDDFIHEGYIDLPALAAAILKALGS